jgi:hypothetical protein
MITALEVLTSAVTSPPLALNSSGTPETDLIQIRNVDGLGPVAGVIGTSKYGSLDGETLIGSSVGKRNIVITVGFNPDWSIQTPETLRAILYRYFMPKNKVKLRFSSSNLPRVEIEGIVETVEPSIFSADPELQISIICPQPYFSAVDATVLSDYTTTIGDGSAIPINYTGTAPTGYTLTLEKGNGADYNGRLLVVNNQPYQPNETIEMSNITLAAAYVVVLNTNPGSKAYQRVQAGLAPQNLLGYITAQSVWSILRPGQNNFRVQAQTPGNFWTMRYNTKYGGL